MLRILIIGVTIQNMRCNQSRRIALIIRADSCNFGCYKANLNVDRTFGFVSMEYSVPYQSDT
jgi:hypothetical protein